MYCPIHFYIKNAPLSVSLSLTYMCTQAHTFCPSHCLSLSQFPSFSISLCLSVSQSLIFSMSPSLHLGGLHFLSGSRSVSQKRRKMICLFLFLSPLLTYSTLSLSVMSYYIINFCLTSCLSVSLRYVSPTLSISLCFGLTASVRVSRSLLPSLLLSLHQFFCLYPSLSLSPFLTLPRSLCYVIYHITNFSVSVSLSVCPCLSYSLAINFCLTFSGCLSLSLALSRTPSSNYGAFADENSE